MRNASFVLLSAAVSAFFSTSTLAAVSADEAKQLGTTLTLWGAQKEGNKDGSIPAYTGDRVKAPASYDPSQPGQVPDPFGDKPQFSITAQNMAQYEDKLTEVHKAMLKQFPKFHMDIYPTRRTVMYPDWVIQNTLKNATACKAVDGGVRLTGCYAGIPFPIPKTGNELVWNHILRYFARAFKANRLETYMVDATGNRISQGVLDIHEEFLFFDKDRPGPAPDNSIYWRMRYDAIGPARKVGEKLVILDSLDPFKPGRRVYSYIPGQRRVKLAPDLAYDTPGPTSGGAATIDQTAVFLGAQDRYDFKSVGKKEVYMIYNANHLADYKKCPPEVALVKNFLNPDCVRWELHRAWVVDMKLKPGFRHILPTRRLYIDEDSPGAASGDSYDASGKIFRADYTPHILYYNMEPQASMSEVAMNYDLQTGIVSMGSWYACKDCGWVEEKPKGDFYFSPEALAGEGIR